MTGQGVRLDKALVQLGLVATRSQAESYIRLGRVKVSGRLVTKSGYFVHDLSLVELDQPEQFVSRAGLKLGSSTGGFTDYALSRGARRVICVDVGTDQLHPQLRRDARVELHEKTDIRDFVTDQSVDIILIDVSFISLREVLPHLAELATRQTQVVAMVKPQFETGNRLKNHGVIKNDTERRRILHDFEQWAKRYFLLRAKADSAVAGARGNRERFYLLTKLA